MYLDPKNRFWARGKSENSFKTAQDLCVPLSKHMQTKSGVGLSSTS